MVIKSQIKQGHGKTAGNANYNKLDGTSQANLDDYVMCPRNGQWSGFIHRGNNILELDTNVQYGSGSATCDSDKR